MVTITLPAPRTRRYLLRVTLGLLSLVLLTGQAPTSAAAASGPEHTFLQLINQDRAAYGLVPLRLSPVLSTELSRPWSAAMARRGTMSHSGTGIEVLAAVGRRFPTVLSAGENVGYAPTVARLHRALMESPGHRANILDRDYRFVGLGVVIGQGVATSDRRVWVTQTFFATGGVLPTRGDTAGAAEPGGR